MEQDTFRTRLSKLIQKTRKALRLYSGGAHVYPGAAHSGRKSQSSISHLDYSAVQVEQWRSVTQDLLEKITPLVEQSNTRKLAAHFYSIRDQFYTEWRLIQAELHQKQQELVDGAENGDFVKSAKMSLELVTLKARMQACQAAHNELQNIIRQSKVSEPYHTERGVGVTLEAQESSKAYGDARIDMQTPADGDQTALGEDSSDHPFGSHAKVIPLRRRQV